MRSRVLAQGQVVGPALLFQREQGRTAHHLPWENAGAGPFGHTVLVVDTHPEQPPAPVPALAEPTRTQGVTAPGRCGPADNETPRNQPQVDNRLGLNASNNPRAQANGKDE